MAAELGKFLLEQLQKLPSNHPDRAYIQSLLSLNTSYMNSGSSSERQQDGIKFFSREALERLEQQGAIIYTLTGKSIFDLKKMGVVVNYGFDCEDNDPQNPIRLFGKTPSRSSEVAIFPENTILKDSLNKPMVEQLKMIKEYSHQLQTDIPGVKAEMGSAADYLDLFYQYLQETGEYILSQKQHLHYINPGNPIYQSTFYEHVRTNTMTGANSVAYVGTQYVNTDSLYVSTVDRGASMVVAAAPLIVPDN